MHLTARLVRLALFLFFQPFALSAVAFAQQGTVDPTMPAGVFADEGPAPHSMQLMVHKADLILRGRVSSLGSPEQLPGSRTPMAVRFQTVDVIEVLKPTGPGTGNPREIRIVQFGGTIISGGREVQTSYPSSIFKEGLDAVFFLRRFPAGGPDTYALVSSLAGVFEVNSDGQSAVVPKGANKMPEVVGHPSLRLADLRSMVRSAQGGSR
jgi:hypothetical protein